MKMLKIFTISILTVLISVNSFADTDGSIELSNKNQNTETKDCFEKINSLFRLVLEKIHKRHSKQSL